MSGGIVSGGDRDCKISPSTSRDEYIGKKLWIGLGGYVDGEEGIQLLTGRNRVARGDSTPVMTSRFNRFQ